jgi:hypothetical protein
MGTSSSYKFPRNNNTLYSVVLIICEQAAAFRAHRMQCAAWPNFLVTHCIQTATTKLPETTVHDTLADNAFLFKMHTHCVCKYFWRLSLCLIFQTDVKRRDVKSSVTTLTYSSTVASCVSFVYGLRAMRQLERYTKHSSQPVPFDVYFIMGTCYSRVHTEPLSRLKSKHFVKVSATVTCHIVGYFEVDVTTWCEGSWKTSIFRSIWVQLFGFKHLNVIWFHRNFTSAVYWSQARHHLHHVYVLYSLSTLPDEYIISFNIDNR